MNYGYHDESLKVNLDKEDESNRYSIQLYHRLVNVINLRDKDIVEIGCGRGGGLEYVAKTFTPANALGIDLENRAITFANNHHKRSGLSFKQGDAQNIPLESNSYDVVLNVESSHRYLFFDKFLAEVTRILKKDGYFLYTDFRYPQEMPALVDSLKAMNMTLIEEQRINPQVISALDHDSERRIKLVKKLTPRIFRKTALNFAGVVDSPTYNQILKGDLVYYIYIFQKK